MINGERIPNMVIKTGRPDNSGLRKLKMIGINNPNKYTRTDGNQEYTGVMP